MRLKLTPKMVGAFLLIGLIPFFIVGLTMLYRADQALEKDAYALLSSAAEYKTLSIENWLQDRKSDVHSVPLTPFYVTSSKTLLNGTKTQKEQARQDVLYEFQVNQRLHGYYNEMKLLDLQGNHLVSLQGITQNESQKGWFNGAINNAQQTKKGETCHDLFVGPLEFCNEIKKPSVHMSHVIRDQETFEPIAVYVVDVNVDKIKHLMSLDTGMGTTGQTYLVNEEGLLLSDLRDEKGSAFTKKIDTIGWQDVFDHKESKRGAGICKNLIYPGPDGHEVLGHNHYLPELGLAVMTEIDDWEALQSITDMKWTMVFIASIGLVLITAIGWFIARSIAKPVVAMTSVMGEMAQDNLDINIPYTEKTDELGEMAGSVNHFKQQMLRVKELEAEQEREKTRTERQRKAAMNQMANSFDNTVGHVVQSVTSAATQLQASSNQLSSTATETSSQATAVAAASEEASANVQTVASAAEELATSQSEISRHVHQSSTVANHAASQAEDTRKTVENMMEEVSKIDTVVNLISDIAEQTNLLALNATIEAARAGEAGKGFAVVASEVKNLANQTAKATNEISQQIGQVQAVTQEAATAINAIGHTITEIDEIANSIAAAVEEQTAATTEIARNVEQAYQGTQEVSINIQSVEQAAGETGSAAGQITMATTELSAQAEVLKSEVRNFLDQVRSDNIVTLLEWDDSLSVGIAEMDNEHKELVEVMNRFYREIQTEGTVTDLTKKLSDFQSVFAQHLNAESTLLRNNNDPQRQAHLDEHDRFLKEIDQLIERNRSGEDVSLDFFEQLGPWIRDHTMAFDKPFAEYVMKHT